MGLLPPFTKTLKTTSNLAAWGTLTQIFENEITLVYTVSKALVSACMWYWVQHTPGLWWSVHSLYSTYNIGWEDYSKGRFLSGGITLSCPYHRYTVYRFPRVPLVTSLLYVVPEADAKQLVAAPIKAK